MAELEAAYAEAVASGLLPGVALIAGNDKGEILYAKGMGTRSLKAGHEAPFDLDTICAVASMTKFVTNLAVMQCVEDGLIGLDDSVSHLIPEMGKYGIITGWDDAKNEGIFQPYDAKKITLRMLATHTSGHEYDWFNPLLNKWRASRGEGAMFLGDTIEQKCSMPLVYEPGKGFAYSVGIDWVGKVVEKLTGETLDQYMKRKIWDPLAITDITFSHLRKSHPNKDRIANISFLTGEAGTPPALDADDEALAGLPVLKEFTGGAKECTGGAGIYASTRAFFTIVQAALRRDTRILKHAASWDEFYKPQLDATCEQALIDYINQDEYHYDALAIRVPREHRKNYSIAGLHLVEPHEGRFSKGTVTWTGVPSITWWIDQEAGVCGVASVQTLPPALPAYMALHEQFQRGILELNSRKVSDDGSRL